MATGSRGTVAAAPLAVCLAPRLVSCVQRQPAVQSPPLVALALSRHKPTSRVVAGSAGWPPAGGMVGSAAYSASTTVVVMAKSNGRGKGGRGGGSAGTNHNRVSSVPLPARYDPVLTNEGLEIASPVVLVDGYNVCGHWGKLKKDFLNGRQEIARQMLIDELVSFSAVREVKVVVVFDAENSGLATHKETYKGVDVVYSADLSADSWIEKEVEALVADGCPKVWVVTSDALEQQLAHGEGALIWSSRRLVKEIKESEKELDEELKQTRSTSLQGKLLQHKLNPKVVHALKGLRNKLEEQERRKK
ncbi:hypothetical protein PR202_ga14124 [Eleusine coracana subsp. coracana]|uniref:NYN domain-containing protein n=1 Tax=Eleusine coracana subsp. coracana TaxID=191504 RepID=A0AAV5CGE0_ELECO|nr:hypothetical protein PR202_ga14124 [Eleusine coracana subsp. coracana]